MTNVDNMPNVEKIIVLDYGSQYNQLITRRIREFGVFSELLSHRITAEEVKAMNPKGIILSGGPNSVYDEKAFGIDEKIFDLGIPVLGICYGMQLITYKLGGKVEPAKNREYGKAELQSAKCMVSNSMPKFVIPNMAMICCVTLQSMFANVQATGQWTTSLIWRSLRSANKWVIRKSY